MKTIKEIEEHADNIISELRFETKDELVLLAFAMISKTSMQEDISVYYNMLKGQYLLLLQVQSQA